MILYLLTLVFILEITVKNSLGGFLSWQESELFCEIGVVKCTQQVVLNSLEKQVTRGYKYVVVLTVVAPGAAHCCKILWQYIR